MADPDRKKRKGPKRKSIKSKALDMNSKRRLAKFGKKIKPGHEGTAVKYMTRNRACQKLQVNLRNFRRLCILKGIYPREPKNKKFATKVCYHVKDIAFLAHEPILKRFWDMRAFMKRVNKLIGRNNLSDAKKAMERKPTYTLEHLVKERYPRFSDSLADMDDALCLLHLFANMPIVSKVNGERIENCLRLTREWQLYVVLSRTLRRTFVSIKGIYYQAEVLGENITWIVPHKFSQNQPKEVDFRVMATFLEFYESMMGFVLFKLYHKLGLKYPPKLDMELDASGAHLACIQTERLDGVEDTMEVETHVTAAIKTTGPTDTKSSEPETHQQKESQKRIKSLSSKMDDIVEADEADFQEMEANQEKIDDADEKTVFAEDDQMKKIEENHRQRELETNLFKGLTFWLSREVPFEPLEFVIRCFGGAVLAEEMGNTPSDRRITHFVSDRPNLVQNNPNCEYIQPQWVFDTVNFRILLPVGRYKIGAELPPHLSPFVNSEAAGYKPEYLEEIEKLQSAAGVAKNVVPKPALLRGITRVDEDGEQESEEENEETVAEKHSKEIENEMSENRKRKRGASKDSNDSDSDDDEEDDDEEKEEEESDEDERDDVDAEEEEDDEEEEDGVEDEQSDSQVVKSKKAKAPATAAVDDDVTPRAKKAKKEKGPIEFVPAKKFLEHKEGYFFRKGPSGLGYYLDVNATRQITFNKNKVTSNRQKRIAEKKEEHERSKLLMSGKARRLYNRMKFGIERRQEHAKKLMERRKK